MTIRKPQRRASALPRTTAPKRSSPRKDIVRDELIARAAEVFQERGYVQTNIGDVARVLGMSRSSLYHYFTSKDELIDIIVANEIAVRDSFAAPIIALHDQPAAPRLRRVLAHRIEREFTRGVSLRMFDQLDRGVAESVLASVRRAHERGLANYTDLIEQGIARGEFRAEDPRLLALSVISMTNWSPWWLGAGDAMPVERIAALLSELAVAAVTATDAPIERADLGGAIALATDLLSTLRTLQ